MTFVTHRFLTSLLAVLLGVATALPLAAQTPSVDDIVRKLRPAEPQMRLMMRGVAVEAPPAEPGPPPSIDLSVNFEFGSARLSSDAVIVLDNLGRALQDPTLQAYRFTVAGHTDGVGSDAVNLRLSEARARAVARYLSEKHRVDTARLTAQGLGFRQLLYPNDPANALNRRVQITTLAPGS